MFRFVRQVQRRNVSAELKYQYSITVVMLSCVEAIVAIICGKPRAQPSQASSSLSLANDTDAQPIYFFTSPTMLSHG